MSSFKVDQLLSRAERKLKNFIGATFGAEVNRIAWKPSVALGKVSEETVTAALKEEVDLIVMAR